MQLTADHELTQSLHDLTEPILQPVSKISASQNNLSASTLQSGMGARTKSQDSGFNKSASWLSLHGSNRKYSHIESKVKKYVQDIKDAEALRKKSLSQNSVNLFVSPPKIMDTNLVCELDENADEIIDKLQSDLRDKEAYIRTLQGSYEDLLLKHAEAENKIDRLRLRSLQRFAYEHPRSRHLFEDGFSFDFKPLSSPERNQVDPKTSYYTETAKLSPSADGSFTPSITESVILSPPIESDQSKSGSSKSRKEVVVSAPLGPIQKLYSTSVRLDKVLQPLSHFSLKSDASNPSLAETQMDQQQEKGASDGRSEDFGNKSNMYYTGAETGTNNLYHMTTDTGIEDCIQSATDRDTAENERRLPIVSELKRIPDVPNEDAFSKVQRWRESLPSSITKVDPDSKLKKAKNRKPVRKTVGVQTSPSCGCIDDPSACNTSALPSDDYAESLDIDCDNYSTEMSHKSPKKKSWNTTIRKVPRSRSLEPVSRHRCCGECKTCGSAIVAPELPSSSASYQNPKERPRGSSDKKMRCVTDKAEKTRRDLCPRKVRCSRVAGAQVTRAVLLDLLLNVQSGHACCCCCQHTWRGRPLPSSPPKEDLNQDKGAVSLVSFFSPFSSTFGGWEFWGCLVVLRNELVFVEEIKNGEY